MEIGEVFLPSKRNASCKKSFYDIGTGNWISYASDREKKQEQKPHTKNSNSTWTKGDRHWRSQNRRLLRLSPQEKRSLCSAFCLRH